MKLLPNIVTQLLAFVSMSVMLNRLSLQGLLVCVLMLVGLLSLIPISQFFRTMTRLKWLFIIILLVFALNTPGEYWVAWPFEVGPTYEGLRAGAAQVLKIGAMLAILSILLASNSRNQLIAGFYWILRPLRCVGLDAQRFAARLWLTLHYVELDQAQTKAPRKNFGHHFLDLFRQADHIDSNDVSITHIPLESPHFTWVDGVIIILLAMILLMVMT